MAYLFPKNGYLAPVEDDDDELVAVGGGLKPEQLLDAYYKGIFPWFKDEGLYYWFSPDPRMVLPPAEFRCSHTLRRLLRNHRFEVRIDTDFNQVMHACAEVARDDEDGTWIGPDYIAAYSRLHQLGYAHSFEAYMDGVLVGGLYGLSMGGFFFGESMFHTVTDASKVAFARLVAFAQMHHFTLIDAQQETPHLASLGARPIPRRDFLTQLDSGITESNFAQLCGHWAPHTVVLLLGGNVGDTRALLQEAVEAIGQRIGKVFSSSALYQTEPWGFTAEQQFLNQAVVVDTSLAAHEVLQLALEIEKELGRKRPAGVTGYTSRTMDIDLIFYDTEIIHTPDLILPHPRMHLRRFVLQPLCDVIPDYQHPQLKQTVRALLEACPDTSEVTPI